MGDCPDVCLCVVEGDRGLIGNGLGTPSSPFVISPDDGRTVAMTGHGTDLGTITVTDDDIGMRFYDLDSGISYVYMGGAYGWQTLAPPGYSSTVYGGTLTVAADGSWQEVANVILPKGQFALTAKGNVEATLPAGGAVTWSTQLWDATHSVALDLCPVSNESAGVPVAPVLRPFFLQSLVAVPDIGGSAITVRMARSAPTGTQLFANVRIQAVQVGIRDL